MCKLSNEDDIIKLFINLILASPVNILNFYVVVYYFAAQLFCSIDLVMHDLIIT